MSNEQNGITGGWSLFSAPNDADRKVLVGDVRPGQEHFAPLLVSKQEAGGFSYVFAANDAVQARQGNQPFPVLVKVYAAPGEAPVVTQMHELGHPDHLGGYGPFQDIRSSPEADLALKEVSFDRAGIRFTPFVASAQLLSGQNYLFAGNAMSATKKTDAYPAFLTVHKPSQGKARIASIKRAWEF
ncbi:hypothetical protein FACS1894137_19390 [Spirochaetia bacterium]|nr:hypothetical protein FACS1894137_19390 [Spirochaetia bacterium]